MSNKIQDRIDSIVYPPTMTYTYPSLTPTGVLANRMKILNQHFPNFFKGENLLDVGCSKGYYTLKHCHNFKHADAFDTDKPSVDLCKQLQPLNVKFVNVGMKNFIPDRFYDKIFIGNVLHHIFNECGDWTFIKKLAAISTEQILLEMFWGEECPDYKDVIKDKDREVFTKERFYAEIDPYFDVVKVVPTVSYTPERYYVLLQRKNKLVVDDKSFIILKRELESTNGVYLAEYKESPGKQFVYKKVSDERKVPGMVIASLYHKNSSIHSLVKEGTKTIAYMEDYVDSQINRMHENEKETVQNHYAENNYLLKVGFANWDPSPINFTHSGIGFDKSLVLPIEEKDDETVDLYKVLIENSYRTVTYEEFMKSNHEELK